MELPAYSKESMWREAVKDAESQNPILQGLERIEEEKRKVLRVQPSRGFIREFWGFTWGQEDSLGL